MSNNALEPPCSQALLTPFPKKFKHVLKRFICNYEGNDTKSSGDMKDEAEAREHTMADSGGDDRADATPRKTLHFEA